MQSAEQVRYRLRLAEGFLEEARQDISSQRWRSCVDHSQLAVENAAKAVLAILGPVGRTHNPAMILRQALEGGRFIEAIRGEVERIAECAESLGPEVHVQSDYGDELGGSRQMHGPADMVMQDALQTAREFQPDGAIYFAHIGCRQACALIRSMRDSLKKELGLSTLVLDCDIMDPSLTSSEELKGKFEEFFEMLDDLR